MIKSTRRATRFAMLVTPLVLAASVMVHSAYSQAPAARTAAQNDGSIYDYADQITRLVQNGKIDELATLGAPNNSRQVARLHDWTTQYVGELQKQEQQRDKQYTEAVSKAQEQFKAEHYDKAMERIVSAYRIAKDPEGFLKQDWVKDLTGRVAARAADLEKKGSWLESLQLYTDLNTLFEVETRYKADMQRLARRTRLIAVYAPKTLFDMRKALLDQEKDPSDTSATQPAMDEDPSNFTRWQDYVENISIDMMKDAVERSADDWVEKTTYDTLVNGGVEALRLFLTTPELYKEFPGLADAANRKAFDDALNGALAYSGSKNIDADDVEKMVKDLIRTSNSSVKLPQEVIIMEFTDGAMEKLDPFTAAIWPHEVDEFEKNTRGSFGGVGIQISLEKDTDPAKNQLKSLDKTIDGQNPEIEKDIRVGGKFKLLVVSPLEDTPAIKAGIQAGDVITGIDGKSTMGISIDQAVHSIMGAPGTPVRLRIKRGTEWEKEFTLTRDVIKVASVKGFQRSTTDSARWNYMLDNDNKVGYVRITGFQEDTADELKSALTSLQSQGMRGVILDLRFNPGGLLNAAVEISDMFLQDGVIVSTKGRSIRSRPQSWNAHSETVIPPNMPVVVLVNEYSASASEIFAGAMKDLHRALIVGHRSFGKGSVQNLLKMGSEMRPDGNPEAMMKLTMAYYYLPNGESLHRKDRSKNWGVDPDVSVDLTPDQLADLLKSRRDADIIHPANAGANGTPADATTKPSIADTQLETALLMMRLQLVQSNGGA